MARWDLHPSECMADDAMVRVMSLRTTHVPLLGITLLALHCGGITEPADGTRGESGSGGDTGGTTGGTGGTGTGGVGAQSGTGGTGTCAVGGSPAWCDDGLHYPSNPMCTGVPAPEPVPCEGDTPLCYGACSACPGSGGAAMVSVGDSCVDSTEVTRADYEAWLGTSPATSGQAAECAWNTTYTPDSTCLSDPAVCASSCENHPQTCVDWCDASAFCASVGKRLCGEYPPTGYVLEPDDPTELGEACHAGTLESYPYGSSHQAGVCNGSELGTGTTVPVGSLPGCARTHADGAIHDLVGNVWEWEAFCEADDCAVRGGSYAESSVANECFAGGKHPRDFVGGNLGFRCCGP